MVMAAPDEARSSLVRRSIRRARRQLRLVLNRPQPATALWMPGGIPRALLFTLLRRNPMPSWVERQHSSRPIRYQVLAYTGNATRCRARTFLRKPIKLESLPRFKDGLSLVTAPASRAPRNFNEGWRQQRSDILDRDRRADVRIQFNEYEFWNVFHRGACLNER